MLRGERRDPAANCADGRDADEVAAFERPVILRARELVAVAGLRQLRRRRAMSGAAVRAQRVDVEADAVADAARARAAVAEVQRQRVGGVAGGEPHRDADRVVALLRRCRRRRR